MLSPLVSQARGANAPTRQPPLLSHPWSLHPVHSHSVLTLASFTQLGASCFFRGSCYRVLVLTSPTLATMSHTLSGLCPRSALCSWEKQGCVGHGRVPSRAPGTERTHRGYSELEAPGGWRERQTRRIIRLSPGLVTLQVHGASAFLCPTEAVRSGMVSSRLCVRVCVRVWKRQRMGNVEVNTQAGKPLSSYCVPGISLMYR